MSVTDFERNDDLDGLTSEELEARAFGPDPAARRPVLSGLVRRPSGAALSPRPPRPARRFVAGAAVAAVLAGLGVYALVSDFPHTHDGYYDWVELDDGDYGRAEHADGYAEHSENGFYYDDEGVYDRIEDSAVYQRALEEGADDVFVDDDGEVSF